MAETIQIKVTTTGVPEAEGQLSKLQNLITQINAKPVKIRIEGDISKEATKAVKAQADLARAEAQRATAENALAVATQQRITAEKNAEAATQRRLATEKQVEVANARSELSEKKAAEAIERSKVEHEKYNTALERRKKREIDAQMQTEKLSKGTKEAGEAAKTAGGMFEKMGEQIKTAISRFILQKPIQELKEALNTLKEVDTQLRTIQKVTDLSAEEVNKMGDAAYSTASKYGIAADKYLEAVAAFSRAGYREASADLAELSMKTQLVGDTNAETANQFLLAVDAAYKLKGNIQELNHVLDAANTIDNNYATTIEKIAEGLGLVSSIAANYGVNTDELTAALGTITKNTQRSGSEAARALRYIMIQLAGNVGAVLDEETGEVLSLDVSKETEKVLSKYAVATREVKNGIEELRNPMDIIGELANRFKTGSLNATELNDIVSQIGGKRQANSLLSLIRDWDTYQEMLDKVADSAGSADKEVSVMLESWESKANILKNTWTEFVAKTMDTNFIKGLIDGATKLLKAFDNLGNAVQLLVGAILMFKGTQIAEWISTTFSSAIQSITGLFNNFTTSVGTATGAIEAQETAMSSATSTAGGYMAILGLILMVYSGISMAASNVKRAHEEQKQQLIDNAQAAQTTSQSLADLIAKYKELGQNEAQGSTGYRNEAIKLQSELTELVGSEAKNIDLINGRLEETNAQLDALLSKVSGDALDGLREVAALYAGEGWLGSTSPFEGPDIWDMFNISNWPEKFRQTYNWAELDAYSKEAAKRLGAEYTQAWSNAGISTPTVDELHGITLSSNVFTAQKQLQIWLDGLKKAGYEGTNVFKNLQMQLNSTTNQANKVEKAIREVAAAEIEAGNGVVDLTGKSEREKEIYMELLDKMARENIGAKEAIEELAEEYTTIGSAVNDARIAIDEFNDAIKGEPDNAYQGLSQVLDKMAEAVNKGYFGSNAFQMGAAMFLNADVIDSFGTEYEKLWEYINEHPLLKSFGDTEDEGRALLEYIETVGREYETAEGTAKVLYDTNGNIIAAVREMGDTFDYYIGNEAIPAISSMSGATEEAIGAMTSALDMFGQESEEFEAELNLNTDEANKNLEEAGEKSDETKEDISEEVEMNVDNQAALDAIQTVQDKLWDVTNKTWVAVVEVKTTGGVNVSNRAGSWRSATGTEHAPGGPTLVNDEPGGYNPELIVENGQAYIAGGGHPTVVDLAPGAQVYNAADTRAILNNAFFDGTIPALASGSGIKKHSATSKYAKGGSKSSSSSSGAKKTTPVKDEETKAAVEEQTELTKEQLDTQKKQLKVQEAQDKVAEKELALQKAKDDLETAKRERTVRYYNEQKQQWEWMADKEAVKKAEEDLAKAESDLKDAQDKLTEAINNLTVAVNNNTAAATGATPDSGSGDSSGGKKKGGKKSGGGDDKTEKEKSASDIIGDLIAQSLEGQTPMTTEQKIEQMVAANGATDKAGSWRAEDDYVPKTTVLSDGTVVVKPSQKPKKTTNQGKSGGGGGGGKKVSMYYDDGGLARGRGILAKAIDMPEAVLDDELTSKILSPVSNAQFESFVNSVGAMFGMAKALDSKVNAAGSSNITDNRGPKYYVNGIQIGRKEAETMPLSKVLSVLPIYANAGR